MPDKPTNSVDGLNRQIEQKAQTDSDLETVVPPTTPSGGLTILWRVGAATLGVAVIAFAMFQAL